MKHLQVRLCAIYACIIAVMFVSSALLKAADPVEVAVQVVIGEVKGVIKSKLIDKHRLVPPIDVNGKWVYVLPLVDYSGSRATDNFAAKWPNKQFPNYHLYILNCPDDLKRKVTFALKGDKGGRSDSTRMDGKEFGDGAVMHFDSNDNYLANRAGINPQDGDIHFLLEKAPNATVILVPEAMQRDEAIAGLKKHFELKKP